MDFNAYLGGSSDSEEEGGVDRTNGRGLEDQITRYRVGSLCNTADMIMLMVGCLIQTLLDDIQGSKGQSEREEMEITWEPGI